jgi:hypothetical protein
MNNFAGNMLRVRGANDKRYLLMSAAASSLTQTNEQLRKNNEILSSSLVDGGIGDGRNFLAKLIRKPDAIKSYGFFICNSRFRKDSLL